MECKTIFKSLKSESEKSWFYNNAEIIGGIIVCFLAGIFVLFMPIIKIMMPYVIGIIAAVMIGILIIIAIKTYHWGYIVGGTATCTADYVQDKIGVIDNKIQDVVGGINKMKDRITMIGDNIKKFDAKGKITNLGNASKSTVSNAKTSV